jgi:hypothetical protein
LDLILVAEMKDEVAKEVLQQLSLLLDLSLLFLPQHVVLTREVLLQALQRNHANDELVAIGEFFL